MSAQHNPGPWKVAGSVVNEISDRDGLLITQRVIGAANARLIAAAPEMLEALKAALPIVDLFRDPESKAVVSIIHAAIIKAEGRS